MMAAPPTSDDFLDLVRKSGLIERERLDAYLEQQRAVAAFPSEPKESATVLVRDGLLTFFQARQLLKGKYRGFILSKYKILERLGSGSNSNVFLCAHLTMRRKVALKVLPLAKAEDPSSLARFYREGRAAGTLDHPNLIHAYDNGQEGNLHFLVMEYVDGSSLQEIVQKHGPMDVTRAAHYVRQTAFGLQHLHEAGLIHRDIKPGNLVLERRGVVKILDMGLARFFHDHKDTLTQNYDHTCILGTADYLSPEQSLNSHDVDVRTDIYSLGATFYFLLAGRPPFAGKLIAQKLLSHQMKEPTRLRQLRPEFPEALAAVLERMMAKDRDQRYLTAAAVVKALTPWTQTPIAPPPEKEMPRLCVAAQGAGSAEAGPVPASPPAAKTTVPVSRERQQQTTYTPHAPFDGYGTEALAPMALAQPGPSAGRSASKPTGPSRVGQPPNGRPSPNPPPPAGPTPDKEHRSPGKRQAPDTENSISGVDTHPDLPYGSPRRPRSPQPTPAGPGRWSRRQLRKLAAVCTVAAVVGGVALHTLFSKPTSPPPVDERPQRAVMDAPTPGLLVVTKTGKHDTFRSVHDALLKARSGDRIAVRDDIEEELVLAGLAATNVVIEARSASGIPVTWRGRANSQTGQPLLALSHAAGLCVKGFIFDGEDRVAELMTVSGRCPGLVLENVQLQGFTRCAIKLIGCTGEEEKPVSLRRVRTLASEDSDAALVFEAGAGHTNQHVAVHDCRFEGPGKAAVLLAGPVSDVHFQRNRFFQAAAGVSYRKAEPLPAVNLSLVSNTFCDLHKALHFETAPPLAGSRIVVQNNLFARTHKLAQVDDFSPEPADVKARWIWYDEGNPVKAAPAEPRYFRQAFEVAGSGVSRADLDVVCDRRFTVWVNGERVGRGELRDDSRRVHAFDVTRRLHPGKNVLAVEGSTRLKQDGSQAPAGLLVRLTYASPGGAPVSIVSGRSWKTSRDGTAGWQRVDFDDRSWAGVRVLPPYGKGPQMWQDLVWDSVIQERFPGTLRPIVPNPKNNFRDKAGKEGFPVLDTRVRDFHLPMDPTDDAQFLLYSKDSPLLHLGAANAPVGVPPSGSQGAIR